MERRPVRCVVIGIGNTERGDDAAGRLVAQRLNGPLAGDVEVAELDGEATALVAKLQQADAAILVDACRSGVPAGTVRRFDVAWGPLPQGTFTVSTHGFGLADAVELTRALGELPRHCVVYAIEGAVFEAGASPSAAVVAAVEQVAERVRNEVARL